MIDSLRDEPSRDQCLAKAYFVGHQEAAGTIFIAIHSFEDVIDRGALKVLQVRENHFSVRPNVTHRRFCASSVRLYLFPTDARAAFSGPSKSDPRPPEDFREGASDLLAFF